jgi:hypothetical protein
MPPLCSLCGYDFQEKTGTWKELVLNHYKEAHSDIMLIFEWLLVGDEGK